MNNRQLDMVLGYLNEGTEIDEISWLVESINETINQFEFVNEDVEIVNEGKILDAIKRIVDKIIESLSKFAHAIINLISSIFRKNEIESIKKDSEKVKNEYKQKTQEEIDEFFNSEETQAKIKALQDRLQKWSDERFGKIKSNNEATDMTKINANGVVDGKSYLTFINIDCEDNMDNLCARIQDLLAALVFEDRKDEDFDRVIEEINSKSFIEHITFPKVSSKEAISGSTFKTYTDKYQKLLNSANSNMKTLKSKINSLKLSIQVEENSGNQGSDLHKNFLKLQSCLTNLEREYGLYISDLRDAVKTAKSNLDILKTK